MQPLSRCRRIFVTVMLCASPLTILSNQQPVQAQAEETEEQGDPAQVTIGERLFLETRFAQFFKTFLDRGFGVNDALPSGDPVLDTTATTTSPLGPGPFAGQSINCRACHLVDEHVSTANGGMRTYDDFARRSPLPLPARDDGKRTTPRNSPPLVNASLKRKGGLLLHFDAEFVTLEDLTAATFTGRNFGWLVGEKQQAIAHMARVIRGDDGAGELAQAFGGLSYAVVLTGTHPSIPPEFRLPRRFRVKVAIATDQEIVDAVSRLVSAYVRNLVFSQDDNGNFNLSPFDVFLLRNDLPQRPRPGETAIEYSRRLLKLIRRLEHDHRLEFITTNPHETDGQFKFHHQPFRFGPTELKGLKVFFTEAAHVPLRPADLEQGGIGNCIACHAAPTFTDFRFHNTGTTQTEYDGVHGLGAFAQLHIPNLRQRQAHPNDFLPATEMHPQAQEPFRSVPDASDPQRTDLGLWNIFANPDFPKPQHRIRRILCEDALQEVFHTLHDVEAHRHHPRCTEAALLGRTIASFKTPGLRDLSHGAPYMHNGQFDSLEDIVRFYDSVSNLARAGTLRNGAIQLKNIALINQDFAALVAFLRSLNEDYE